MTDASPGDDERPAGPTGEAALGSGEPAPSKRAEPIEDLYADIDINGDADRGEGRGAGRSPRGERSADRASERDRKSSRADKDRKRRCALMTAQHHLVVQLA